MKSFKKKSKGQKIIEGSDVYLVKISYLSIVLKQKVIRRGVNDICAMSGSNIVKLHIPDGIHECT